MIEKLCNRFFLSQKPWNVTNNYNFKTKQQKPNQTKRTEAKRSTFEKQKKK